MLLTLVELLLWLLRICIGGAGMRHKQKGYRERCAAACQSLTGQSLPGHLHMQAAFGINFDPAWVMELESDAPHKFSRHLIIQIPGMAFANNLHVGAFVNEVCAAAVDSQSGISSLQVAKVLTAPLCASSRTACWLKTSVTMLLEWHFLPCPAAPQRIALDLSTANSSATAARFLMHLVEPLMKSAYQLKVCCYRKMARAS